MSFVERNKAWILPLLAAGVAGVAYMNYRSFSAPAPASPAAASPAPAAGAPAAAPAEPPPPQPSSMGGDSTLWEDLRPLAVVPQGLVQTEAMQSRATGVLGDDILRPPSPASSPFPVPPEPEALKPEPRGGGSGAADPLAVAPPPDFLIQIPEGRRVWFAGEGYRVHQKVEGSPFVVKRIGQDQVVLQGPGGPQIRSTHSNPFPEAP